MQHLADFSDTKEAARYADVLPTDLEKFRAFCQVCPYKQVTLDGVAWP